ncbi:spore cortex biosynthesis protein YabQ [bacterium LRH843]|nr:spore cortex biosynthesis protein YabQ [bacterium LRH843]
MSLTVQFYTMLSMAAMGIYIGAAIDTYGRFSKKRHTFHWLVACNDLLFWLIQAFVVFYVLLQSNNGEIRFYIFLAILCGYAAYQALFHSLYKRLLERLINLVIGLYRFITKLFLFMVIKPIKFILKLLYSLCMMVLTGCLTILLFLLKVIWKPIQWFLLLLLKWTGLNKQLEKGKISFKKIKEFVRLVRKRKE